jgi:uncharacterized protein YdhG (YjbR/CyaY superfamily)
MIRRSESVEATMQKPTSVEAYLQSLTPEQRSALEKLREAIAAAAPDVEEGITYSMPGFLLDGKGFVAYAAFKNHYSFFPMSTRAIDAHRDELGPRITGRGTISFEYGRRLPTALVKKVVRTRLRDALARRFARKTAPRS